MKDIETLKGRVGTKAKAHLVQDEFTKIRRDSREEMVNLMARTLSFTAAGKTLRTSSVGSKISY